MRINHNLNALNAWRNLGSANTSMGKSLEKLSSGLRINRAGDDAAGLSISEKMRGQIRGLDMAVKNAQDSISLIQTAEGALTETHSILQRMRELAVQSANDTNESADRDALQSEINQLAEEITRIADTTEFNNKKVLDGTFEKAVFHIGANEGQNIELSINKMDSASLGVAGNEAAEMTKDLTSVISISSGQDVSDGSYTVIDAGKYEGTTTIDSNATQVIVDTDGEAVMETTDGVSYNSLVGSGNDTMDLGIGGKLINGSTVNVSSTDISQASIGIVDGTGSGVNQLSTGEYTVQDISTNATYGGTYNYGLVDSNGDVVALGASDSTGTAVTTSGVGVVDYWVSTEDTSEVLLTAGDADFLYAEGDTINVTGKGIDISTQTSADSAITTINDAITQVSSERSKLGAYQNRLEHTINNLSVAGENLTAAESRIRDVDMAREMMKFTKDQILLQSSNAMLAQANQLPQNVLSLLR